jgi:hypothetical protein
MCPLSVAVGGADRAGTGFGFQALVPELALEV